MGPRSKRKEPMPKKLKESLRIRSHQVENINNKWEIIKRNSDVEKDNNQHEKPTRGTQQQLTQAEAISFKPGHDRPKGDTIECPPKDWRTKTKKKGQSPRNLWAPSDTPAHIDPGGPGGEQRRGRKGISGNNGWKTPKSDEKHYSTYSGSSTNFTQNRLTCPHLDTAWWSCPKIKTNRESCTRRLATRNWAPTRRDSMPASQLGARKVRVAGAHFPAYTCMGMCYTHTCAHTHVWKRPKACPQRSALAWALSGCVSVFSFSLLTLFSSCIFSIFQNNRCCSFKSGNVLRGDVNS